MGGFQRLLTGGSRRPSGKGESLRTIPPVGRPTTPAPSSLLRFRTETCMNRTTRGDSDRRSAQQKNDGQSRAVPLRKKHELRLGFLASLD